MEEKLSSMTGVPSLGFCVENIWSYHRRDVVKVHLATGLFIDMRKRSNPIKKCKDNFHGIPIAFRQETTGEMQHFNADSWIAYFYPLALSSQKETLRRNP